MGECYLQTLDNSMNFQLITLLFAGISDLLLERCQNIKSSVFERAIKPRGKDCKKQNKKKNSVKIICGRQGQFVGNRFWPRIVSS